MKLISVVTFALILFAGFGESFLIGKGQIPFGLELSKAGPFMNVQFIAVFLIGAYALEKNRKSEGDDDCLSRAGDRVKTVLIAVVVIFILFIVLSVLLFFCGKVYKVSLR